MNKETIPTPNAPLRLRLTSGEAYQRKQKLWRLYCQWAEQVRRAFFPDTGGVSLFLHNWHKCQNSDPKRRDLAEWVDNSTCARYRKLEAIMEARSVRREHEEHAKVKSFDPFWCPICHPERVHLYHAPASGPIGGLVGNVTSGADSGL